MFKKLRYWIIKKLGGYTEQITIKDFSAKRYEPVTLRAKALQRNFEKDIPVELFREELLRQLAKGISPYVTFTKRDCSELDGIEHCAEIKILSEQGTGGANEFESQTRMQGL